MVKVVIITQKEHTNQNVIQNKCTTLYPHFMCVIYSRHYHIHIQLLLLLRIFWLKINLSKYPWTLFNTLRPRQNGGQFPDGIFKCIFQNENISISITMSLNFVPKAPINNISALIQIMAWRRPGDKPLSEPMMVTLLTHICVMRPQWVA